MTKFQKEICLPHKNISELKQGHTVHIFLLGTCSKSKIQQQTGIDSIKNIVTLNGMIMIDPTTCWFKIIKGPT